MANWNHNALQAHSQPGKEHIIFSVFDNNKSKAYNETNHDHVRARLSNWPDITYVEATGKYKGYAERSFITSMDHLDYVVDLANEFNQETILILKHTDGHGLRPAILMHLKDFNRLEPIGWLKEVSKDRAISMDNFVYRPDMDKYWTTVTDRNKEVFIE